MTDKYRDGYEDAYEKVSEDVKDAIYTAKKKLEELLNECNERVDKLKNKDEEEILDIIYYLYENADYLFDNVEERGLH